MSNKTFTKDNNVFLTNTDFESQSVVKLQGIKPNFFYDNLVNNNFIELNINNDAVAPFFDEISMLVENFENNPSNAKIYLGLYFVELDLGENEAFAKAPLLLLPVTVVGDDDKFKLKLDETTEITVNPFLEDYFNTHSNIQLKPFSEFENLGLYAQYISDICIKKDYLLKNLSILGVCTLNPSKVEFANASEKVEEPNSTIFNNVAELSTSENNRVNTSSVSETENDANSFKNNEIQDNDTFEDILNSTEYSKILDIVSTQTVATTDFKISAKQKESQLSSLQIHPLTKPEKDVLFSVKQGENVRVSKFNKSNSLPLLSNLTLLSLMQNKKVLYLSNNKSSINKLHEQIKTDGFENFVLVVDDNTIINDESTLFDTTKMQTTFINAELNALIDAKKALKLELNDYLKTTHKVFENMNLTLLDVVQKIITLKEENNITKTYDILIPNITEFSPLDLHRYTFHLNNYVKYFEASKIELENTFWKNIDFSSAQKSDLTKIENTLSELKTILEHLEAEDNTIVSSTIGYKPSDVKNFYNLYTNINDDIFSTDYIYSIEHDAIIHSLNKLVELQNTFEAHQKDIYNLFDDNIFSSDILVLNSNLQANINTILELIGNENYTSSDDIINNLEVINNQATNLLDTLTQAFEISDELSEYFSISNCETVQQIKLLVEMFSFVLEDVKINDLWFDEAERLTFISNIDKAKACKNTINAVKQKLSANYIDEIFNIDYQSVNNQLSIAKDTDLDPVATKLYRYLKTFKLNVNDDVDFLEATELIADLTDYNQSLDEFNNLISLISIFYGKQLTIDSDFDAPLRNITIFDETLLAFDNQMPDKIKNFLVSPTSEIEVLNEYTHLSELLKTISDETHIFTDIVTLEKDELINTLNTIVTSSDEATYLYEKISDYALPDVEISVVKITETTNKISALVEVQDNFENLFEVTSKKVPDLLTSYNIDLEAITADLEVFKQLKKLLTKFEVAENDFYDFAKTIRQEILSNTQRFNYLIDEAIELFKIVFDFANNSAEICKNFEQDLVFVNKLQNDFNLAKKGYKFSHSSAECSKLSLDSFLHEVDEDNIEASQIINTFLVSFYTSWLKETLQKVNLKGDVDYLDIHNKINEYFKISEDIYLYNKSSLYSRISDAMPVLTTNKSTFDEVNILLEEIKPNKETDFISILNKIPNLIFEIKPCLITTLDEFVALETNRQVNFDIIIIDDATNINLSPTIADRILTKQLVVLGDTFNEFVDNNVFFETENTLQNVDLLSLQTQFNHTIAKFLNTNYYDKKLFIPYTKNFDLDFKNEFVESKSKDGVNELEAYRVVELLQQYYSDDKNEFATTHVITLSDEHSLFINNLLLTDETLSRVLENGNLQISHLNNIELSESDLTVFSLCVTTFDDLTRVTSNLKSLTNLVTILLNTVKSVYIVESLSLLSKMYDENWNDTIKLLFKLVQQFVSTDEMYELELQKNADLFTTQLVDDLDDEFDVYYSHKNHYNNILVSNNNSSVLVQNDQYINNKTDFDEIYLKQHFTEVIDNVKIQNVFGFSWYLSDNYKSYIHNELERKMNQPKELEKSLLLKEVALPLTDTNFFGLIPYELADLYEIEPVEDMTIFVANAITHIVRVESPIHSDLVFEKLKSLLGTSNSTFNLNATIDLAFKTYLDGVVTVKDGFFWNTLSMEAKPRIPSNVATTRYITHIADEELSAILYEIIKKSYGIRLDSLVTSCCKELGFTMQSLTIKNKIFTAYNKLLEDNKIATFNNKLKAL